MYSRINPLEARMMFYGLEQPELFSEEELRKIVQLTNDIQQANTWQCGSFHDYHQYLHQVNKEMPLNEKQWCVMAKYLAKILNI